MLCLEAPSPAFGAASPEEEGTLLRLRSHRKTTSPKSAPAGLRLCWGGGTGGPGSPAELGRSPSGQPVCGGRFVAVARSFLSSQTLSLVGGKKNFAAPKINVTRVPAAARGAGPAATRSALPGCSAAPSHGPARTREAANSALPRGSGCGTREGVRDTGQRSARANSEGEKPSAPEPPPKEEQPGAARLFRLQTGYQGEAAASGQENPRGAGTPRPPVHPT